MIARATPVLPGEAQGPVLRLREPISFWGGIDPRTGTVTDPGSTACGRVVTGTVLVIAATRGSSSASAVLLELLHAGRAPAALVLGAVDAILGLGVLVAAEMGWPTIPLAVLSAASQEELAEGTLVRLTSDGRIEHATQAT